MPEAGILSDALSAMGITAATVGVFPRGCISIPIQFTTATRACTRPIEIAPATASSVTRTSPTTMTCANADPIPILLLIPVHPRPLRLAAAITPKRLPPAERRNWPSYGRTSPRRDAMINTPLPGYTPSTSPMMSKLLDCHLKSMDWMSSSLPSSILGILDVFVTQKSCTGPQRNLRTSMPTRILFAGTASRKLLGVTRAVVSTCLIVTEITRSARLL
mmetsp:Transcript_32982/g.72339  ORF Transcript_32982/g.72339 Transcript_32982/m.72339 type:complete len:218 (+) Transcript_32982:197-850(+)